jgi:hypothetical protein
MSRPGTSTVSSSPTSAPICHASTRPMIIARAPGFKSARRPCSRCCSTLETPASACGSTPCSSTGSSEPARPIMACTSTNGATPRTPGTLARRDASLRHSAMRAGGPEIVAWAVSETSRLRSSPSKPFMTEMIVISAATPRHTPAIEIQEMNETKKPWRRVRT